MEVTEFIIKVVTCIVIIVSCGVAVVQLRNTVRLKYSEYLEKLIEKFRTDKRITKAHYLIEYDIQWYDIDFHNGSKYEPQIDRMLTYLSYLLYLKKFRVIDLDGWRFFQYNLERTVGNRQIQAYLFNLYHFSNRFGTYFPYSLILEYGKKNRFITEDFDSPENAKYPRYLNF